METLTKQACNIILYWLSVMGLCPEYCQYDDIIVLMLCPFILRSFASLPLIIFPAPVYYFKGWSQGSGSHTKHSHFTLIYLIASIYLMATSHVHMMNLIILIHIVSTYVFILTEVFFLIAKAPATFLSCLSCFVNHWV